MDDGWPDEPATDIASSKLVDSASDPSSEAGQSDVKKPMEQRGTKRDRKKKVTNLFVSIFLINLLPLRCIFTQEYHQLSKVGDQSKYRWPKLNSRNNIIEQECIPVGCVPAARRPHAGVCFPGGSAWSWGVSAWSRGGV